MIYTYMYIYVYVYIHICCIYMCVYICVYISHIVIHSLVGGHLSSLHSLVIVNKAIVNIGAMYPFKSVFLYSLSNVLALS